MKELVKTFSNFSEIIKWIHLDLYPREVQKKLAKEIIGISEKTYFDYKKGKELKKQNLKVERQIIAFIRETFGYLVEREAKVINIYKETVAITSPITDPERDLIEQNKKLIEENNKLKNMIINLYQKLFDLEK
jgi:hypothetical protein